MKSKIAKVTLGRLARLTGLARASLLHYESLGLLKPVGRTAAGYRLYGQAEIERLQSIRKYRDAGLSLAAIRDLCAAPRRTEPAAIIEARLSAISVEVERLKMQQRLLARLLASRQFRNVERCRDKKAWSQLLQRAGFTDAEMRMWHECFEAEAPLEHKSFLETLGLSPAEVRGIRRWSKLSDSD